MLGLSPVSYTHLDVYKRQLEHHALTAPFDSVVVERYAEAGMVVRAGDVIFTLMDTKTVWVQSYIAVSYTHLDVYKRQP